MSQSAGFVVFLIQVISRESGSSKGYAVPPDQPQTTPFRSTIYKFIGQYYALSHTIAGRARMKAADGRPAALGNPKLLVKITRKEKVKWTVQTDGRPAVRVRGAGKRRGDE
jgi:hypothetical protein